MATPRITAEQRELIADLHAKGLGRNVIARRLAISGDAVTRACKRMGLTFDREATRIAVAARKADAAALRAELELDLLEDAVRLRGQLWSPHTYIDHGGKDFTKVEWTQDEPSPGDKYRLMQSAGIAVEKSMKLADYDKDDQVEAAKSMLVDLFEQLGVAWRAGQDDDQEA